MKYLLIDQIDSNASVFPINSILFQVPMPFGSCQDVFMQVHKSGTWIDMRFHKKKKKTFWALGSVYLNVKSALSFVGFAEILCW